jgi:hypothetical protein
MLDSLLGLAFWAAVLLVGNLLAQRASHRATPHGFVGRLSPSAFIALLLAGLMTIVLILAALSARF